MLWEKNSSVQFCLLHWHNKRMNFTLHVISGRKKKKDQKPLWRTEKNILTIFQLLSLSVFAQLMYWGNSTGDVSTIGSHSNNCTRCLKASPQSSVKIFFSFVWGILRLAALSTGSSVFLLTEETSCFNLSFCCPLAALFYSILELKNIVSRSHM